MFHDLRTINLSSSNEHLEDVELGEESKLQVEIDYKKQTHKMFPSSK